MGSGVFGTNHRVCEMDVSSLAHNPKDYHNVELVPKLQWRRVINGHWCSGDSVHPDWKEYIDQTTNTKYYYNASTNESKWQPPCGSRFVSGKLEYLRFDDSDRKLDSHVGLPTKWCIRAKMETIDGKMSYVKCRNVTSELVA